MDDDDDNLIEERCLIFKEKTINIKYHNKTQARGFSKKFISNKDIHSEKEIKMEGGLTEEKLKIFNFIKDESQDNRQNSGSIKLINKAQTSSSTSITNDSTINPNLG